MIQPDNEDSVRHKDEYPSGMQEVGEALDLFNDDGTLKNLDQIVKEGFDD